ncbi:cation:proton antiporter [Streptomyces sp. NPDC049881]|uniref:cation:proton antiporter domain-containing protein n=1 Tax=unclassified Streptomyces TaxID=2593676 RepID=UPI00342A4DF8
MTGPEPGGAVGLAATSPDMLTAVMLVDIALVLLAGILLGRLARRLRQPAVIGEITAGILLGPSLLGLLPGDLPQEIFPTDVRPLLNAVSQVGLVLFMFVIGWEFEKRLIRPHARLAAGVSFSSIALAFGLGVALATLLHPDHSTVAGEHISFAAFALFMGTAMSVTAFPVLARILSDNRLLDTRVGSLALASAAIDDVLAWCLLAYVSAMVSADGDYGELVRIAAFAVVYTLGMFLVVRPLLARLVWRWAASERWAALLVVLSAGAMTSAWLTSWVGVHAIFGAFLFGFVTPREPAQLLAVHLRKPLADMSLVLLPVFFVVTGLGVDLGSLTSGDVLALVLIVTVACAGKLLGAIVPARVAGLGWRESKDLGLLMNTRGLTELIILNAGVSLGVLDGRMFTMMVMMALVTTVMAAPLLSARDTLAGLTPGGAGDRPPEPPREAALSKTASRRTEGLP